MATPKQPVERLTKLGKAIHKTGEGALAGQLLLGFMQVSFPKAKKAGQMDVPVPKSVLLMTLRNDCGGDKAAEKMLRPVMLAFAGFTLREIAWYAAYTFQHVAEHNPELSPRDRNQWHRRASKCHAAVG